MNPCCSTIYGVFSVPPLNTPPKNTLAGLFLCLNSPYPSFYIKESSILPLLIISSNHLHLVSIYFKRKIQTQKIGFTPDSSLQTQKNRPCAELIISNLVGICGLEPQTSSLSVTRSNQLSYIPNTTYFTP